MKAPLRPVHPERICWGCEKFCPAESLACGNGTIRTMHPIELFGDHWMELELKHDNDSGSACRLAVEPA